MLNSSDSPTTLLYTSRHENPIFTPWKFLDWLGDIRMADDAVVKGHDTPKRFLGHAKDFTPTQAAESLQTPQPEGNEPSTSLAARKPALKRFVRQQVSLQQYEMHYILFSKSDMA